MIKNLLQTKKPEKLCLPFFPDSKFYYMTNTSVTKLLKWREIVKDAFNRNPFSTKFHYLVFWLFWTSEEKNESLYG